MSVNYICQFCEDSAERWPERIALISGGHSISFKMLQQQIVACCELLKDLGLKPGERVVLAAPKQPEFVVMLLAVARLGAIFVPVHTQLKPAQLAHVLQDCQAAMLLTNQHRLTQLSLTGMSLDDICVVMTEQLPLAISEFISKPSTALPPINTFVASDVAAIMYTSGSTGLPKGVVLSQQNLTLGTFSVCQYLQISSSDVILALLRMTPLVLSRLT